MLAEINMIEITVIEKVMMERTRLLSDMLMRRTSRVIRIIRMARKKVMANPYSFAKMVLRDGELTAV